MSTIAAEGFFRLYEQANNDFDIELISKLYADTFMFANLQGVQAVKKEDFVKILPRRKDSMKAAGLLSLRVSILWKRTVVDSKYVLAKTVWNMRVRANNGDEKACKTSATYIFSTIGDWFEIIFQSNTTEL